MCAAPAEVPIRLRGVCKAFRGHLGIGRTVAVEKLELEVRRGEIFGLLGPNGAGKTTTVKLILGLLRPDAGEVRLCGRPPRQPEARRRVGFLPEQPYFYQYLTVRELLDLCARLRGLGTAARRREVESALETLSLQAWAHTPIRKLSKGLVQRVGLAQALLGAPEVVILDEPMSGLDPIGRREVRDLILGLRRQGTTVLFSSHILQDAEVLCDRVAILFAGRLRAEGRLEELIEPAVRAFEVRLEGMLPPGCPAETLARGDGSVLVRVPDAEALTRLLGWALGHGVRVTSVSPRRESLEDRFLREVGARAREGVS